MTRIVLATLLVAVLSVVGWWVAIFQPAREQQLALEEETATLLAQEAQLTSQREQLLALREQAPVIREQLDRLGAYIPPDPDQARLLDLMQGAATAAGVTFTSLAFTDPVAVTGAPATSDPALVLGTTSVSGSMQAQYFQLVDFLRRLEVGSSRAILVTGVGLAEGEGGFPQLAATFTAEIFSLIPAPLVPVPPAEALPPDGQATPTPTPSPTAAPGAQSPAAPTPVPATPPGEAQVGQTAPSTAATARTST